MKRRTLLGLGRVERLSANQFYSGPTLAQPIAQQNWTLTIGGLIESEPQTLSWADLESLPRITERRTLESAGNPAGGPYLFTGRWHGVRLGDVLAPIRLSPQAGYATLRATNGYSTTIPLATLTHPAAMLAFGLDSRPLGHFDGAPARLILPGVYEYKMPRWIHQIEFTETPIQGYWESQGWSLDGTVKTRAAITAPMTRAQVGRRVHLMGHAFAGLRSIKRVEIRFDDGLWSPVNIVRESPLVACKWSLIWEPPLSGYVQIEARAVDSEDHSDESHRIYVEVV